MTASRSDAQTDSFAPADPSATPLIEACGLRKVYGSAVAVEALSFTVARGEVVGFLGPNGAGKSTTMKMLTGFLRPSRGHARIGGIPVADDPLAVRRMLGYLPENAPLYDDMMVIDFLRFVADLRGVPRAEQDDRLHAACQRCGLLQVLGKDIGQLSKGYRQRTGLAQALLHDPALLILDEPTSGLDPNQIVEIRELIRDLGRDKTVMLSTHILSEVQATCDRVLILHDGRLVADGRPETLSQQDGGQAASRLLQASFGCRAAAPPAAELADKLALLEGVLEVVALPGDEPQVHNFALRTAAATDARAAIFDFAVREQLVLLGLQRQIRSLEEAFRALTHTAPSAGALRQAAARRGTPLGGPHA